LTLMMLSQYGLLTVNLLIGLTFIGGIGAALMGPTWQAIVPELVPRAGHQERGRAEFARHQCLALRSARPPAASCWRTFGASSPMAPTCISYMFVIAALLWWPRAKAENDVTVREVLRRVPGRPALHTLEPRAACRAAARSDLLCCSPARSGRCCRWWRVICWVAMPAFTASCSVRSARARSVGALLLPRLRAKFDADAPAARRAVVGVCDGRLSTSHRRNGCAAGSAAARRLPGSRR
jgi:MFS family permease